MNKKVLCCLLVLCFLIPCFCSCKFMTLSDAQAKEELERLLPKAKELTEIFYGKGLPYDALPEDSTDYYAFVSKDAAYQSIDEIKKAAETVFSTEYLVSIYEYAFEGTDYFASRYFMSVTEGKQRLKINIQHEPMALLKQIDIDSAKVVEGTPATAVVEVNVITSKGKEKKKKITLVNQDGIWVLDSAAY